MSSDAHEPDRPEDDAHLPVVEHDRDLDDWGRSARLTEFLDKTVWDAAHRVWFRTSLEQPKLIPPRGGTLVVVNGSGPLSPIAPALAKAIHEVHPSRRRARLCSAGVIQRQPGVGTLLTRAGAVGDHPDDLQRLLADEGELLILCIRTSAQNRVSAIRSLASHPALAAAVYAGAPVVPVASLGVEDTKRQIVPADQKSSPGRSLPTAIPKAGIAALSSYLPAKVQIRALDPIPASSEVSAGTIGLVANSVIDALEAGIADLRKRRKSRWRG